MGESPAWGRAALLAEFRSNREALLQACWAHRLWKTTKLATTDSRALQVVFPGWLNRGPGPDFTEARVVIGDSEWFGDVEIHLDERNWTQHGHDRDPRYAKVVLHVVLDRFNLGEKGLSGPPRAAVFHAAPFLPDGLGGLLHDPEGLLARYASLPGRCGLRGAMEGPTAVGDVIAHAAEVRARQKAERLQPRFESQDEEQILFELVFQSLGYRPYADAFLSLASRFPLRSLRPLLDLPRLESRDAVLSRWFGASGLLDEELEAGADEVARQEHARWRSAWKALGLRDPPLQWARRSGRPWNSPERRMVGMFHHLYRMHAEGWLKAWLRFLVELDRLREQARLARAAVEALNTLFETPADEPWRRRYRLASAAEGRSARLIGADRAIILMANAVIPFFLARARRSGDEELEKLLYRLFIVLPPEAANWKTRFMEQRLLLAGRLSKSLRSQQGLLQIHQDFCASFDAGCENCALPDLISARTPRYRDA
jgi:hypothetical protein